MHGVPHEEAVEKDGGCGEGYLGEFEHDADLEDEIYAFAAVFALGFRGKAVEDGGGAFKFGFGEEPLCFSNHEDLTGKGLWLLRLWIDERCF